MKDSRETFGKRKKAECISLRDLWSGFLWTNFKTEGTASPC